MTTNSTTRTVVYTRISDDREGRELGVARQLEDCRQLAARNGDTVTRIYSDNDIGASTRSRKPRPEYQKMIKDARDGLIDKIIAYTSGRLTRRPREHEDLIDLAEQLGVAFGYVASPGFDLNTAAGRRVARILAATDAGEAEDISERARREKEQSAAAGKWIGGRQPFGYRLLFDRPEQPHKVVGIELNEKEAAAIRDGVTRTLAGESTYSIARRWQATIPTSRGGKWSIGNVTRTLCRAANAGLSEHRGEIVGTLANWPPIITPEELAAVRVILKNPKRTSYSGVRSLKWVGSGLYRCGDCGADLRSATTSASSGSVRRIYRCRASNGHVNINGEALDAYVMSVMCGLLDRHGRGLIPVRDVQATNTLNERSNALNAKLDELADMVASDEMDRPRYNVRRNKVLADLDAVARQLDGMRTGSTFDGVADAKSPSAAFLAAPVARQRAITDTVLTITVNRPTKKQFGPRPFDHGRVVITERARQAA